MTRTEDFVDGAEKVRKPQFRSVQQQHNANFHAMSVLDAPGVIPNSNGRGTADTERVKYGRSDSPTGVATGTYDQRMWLNVSSRRPENS